MSMRSMDPKAFDELNGEMPLKSLSAPACMDDLKAKGIKYFVHLEKSNVLETMQQFNELFDGY